MNANKKVLNVLIRNLFLGLFMTDWLAIKTIPIVVLIATLILNVIAIGNIVNAQNATEKAIPGSNFSRGAGIPVIKDPELKAEPGF